MQTKEQKKNGGDPGMRLAYISGAFRAEWVGQLWHSELLSLGDMLEKHRSLGKYLFGHRMSLGFGPLELPTSGLLQKERNHSLPKTCFNGWS